MGRRGKATDNIHATKTNSRSQVVVWTLYRLWRYYKTVFQLRVVALILYKDITQRYCEYLFLILVQLTFQEARQTLICNFNFNDYYIISNLFQMTIYNVRCLGGHLNLYPGGEVNI